MAAIFVYDSMEKSKNDSLVRNIDGEDIRIVILPEIIAQVVGRSVSPLVERSTAIKVESRVYTRLFVEKVPPLSGHGAGFATLGMQNPARRRNYFVSRTVLCQNCFHRSFFWRRISERLITSPINNG
jgi:hypothetical protein